MEKIHDFVNESNGSGKGKIIKQWNKIGEIGKNINIEIRIN